MKRAHIFLHGDLNICALAGVVISGIAQLKGFQYQTNRDWMTATSRW